MDILPEGCIAHILSLTTPADAARLSVVSELFRSAAGSDYVWNRFLPSDVVSIIPPSELANFPSKKALYLALSDRRRFFITEEGRKSPHLDRKSGKKCYMLAARALAIVWSEDPRYWRWIILPESRFPEVAYLRKVCWFEIRGEMSTRALSPNTQYAAYLVFKMDEARGRGFENRPVELSVGIFGGKTSTKSVCLDPKPAGRRHDRVVGLPWPNMRSDGWLEIEMGVFFSSGRADERLQMKLSDVIDGHWKRGLSIEGIEIRPLEEN